MRDKLDISKKTSTDLADELAASPKDVVSLDLSAKNLQKKDGTDLAEAIAAISESAWSFLTKDSSTTPLPSRRNHSFFKPNDSLSSDDSQVAAPSCESQELKR